MDIKHGANIKQTLNSGASQCVHSFEPLFSNSTKHLKVIFKQDKNRNKLKQPVNAGNQTVFFLCVTCVIEWAFLAGISPAPSSDGAAAIRLLVASTIRFLTAAGAHCSITHVLAKI